MSKPIKVTNRSVGTVVYAIPELNIRRVFNVNESKDIPLKELNACYNMHGGAELIKHDLMVEDRDWVKNTFDAPVEYFWGYEEIQKCLLEDDTELFSETLDYAPSGVIDIIKLMAWKLPIKDLNKIQVLRDKLGFDVLAAVQIMAPPGEAAPAAPKAGRRRREEA
jgi:hypothetical protein